MRQRAGKHCHPAAAASACPTASSSARAGSHNPWQPSPAVPPPPSRAAGPEKSFARGGRPRTALMAAASARRAVSSSWAAARRAAAAEAEGAWAGKKAAIPRPHTCAQSRGGAPSAYPRPASSNACCLVMWMMSWLKLRACGTCCSRKKSTRRRCARYSSGCVSPRSDASSGANACTISVWIFSCRAANAAPVGGQGGGSEGVRGGQRGFVDQV
eukprot:970535-Prorocentrum_minimum.AAC.1